MHPVRGGSLPGGHRADGVLRLPARQAVHRRPLGHSDRDLRRVQSSGVALHVRARASAGVRACVRARAVVVCFAFYDLLSTA